MYRDSGRRHRGPQPEDAGEDEGCGAHRRARPRRPRESAQEAGVPSHHAERCPSHAVSASSHRLAPSPRASTRAPRSGACQGQQHVDHARAEEADLQTGDSARRTPPSPHGHRPVAPTCSYASVSKPNPAQPKYSVCECAWRACPKCSQGSGWMKDTRSSKPRLVART